MKHNLNLDIVLFFVILLFFTVLDVLIVIDSLTAVVVQW
jgi:hypothetical protein